jgi:predicted nucleotidyltransferase
MIEVKLQPREKNHPAVGHLQWWGRKGHFWDMDFIEHASKEQLDTLQDALEEVIVQLVPELIDLIIDIEVCGSYAYGIQRCWSDFDIQLVAKNQEDQKKVEKILASKSNLLHITCYELSVRLKHNIEIHYSVHNNKETGVEVYSLRERKLYNREEGKRMSENYRRRFNKETHSYNVSLREPPIITTVYWDDDGNETEEII